MSDLSIEFQPRLRKAHGVHRVLTGDKLRVTMISPGFVRTEFIETVTNPEVKAQLAASRDKFAISPDAIARAIAFAIEQPAESM